MVLDSLLELDPLLVGLGKSQLDLLPLHLSPLLLLPSLMLSLILKLSRLGQTQLLALVPEVLLSLPLFFPLRDLLLT